MCITVQLVTSNPGLTESDDSTASCSNEKKSILDLFQSIDESEIVTEDSDNVLSYSDQLAEILPTLSSQHRVIADLPCEQQQTEDNEPSDQIDSNKLDNVTDASKSEEINVTLDISETTDKCLTESTNTASLDKKYNIVLEPEDNFNLFCSQHSFKLTQLRYTNNNFIHRKG